VQAALPAVELEFNGHCSQRVAPSPENPALQKQALLSVLPRGEFEYAGHAIQLVFPSPK